MAEQKKRTRRTSAEGTPRRKRSERIAEATEKEALAVADALDRDTAAENAERQPIQDDLTLPAAAPEEVIAADLTQQRETLQAQRMAELRRQAQFDAEQHNHFPTGGLDEPFDDPGYELPTMPPPTTTVQPVTVTSPTPVPPSQLKERLTETLQEMQQKQQAQAEVLKPQQEMHKPQELPGIPGGVGAAVAAEAAPVVQRLAGTYLVDDALIRSLERIRALRMEDVDAKLNDLQQLLNARSGIKDPLHYKHVTLLIMLHITAL